MNQLYYGSGLPHQSFMQEFPLGVDLIYLDPPFNSNRQYNAIYQDETGRPLPDQIEALCDMWELDQERERAIRTMPVLMRENGIADATVDEALDARPPRDTAAPTGVSVLQDGRAASDYAPDSQADRQRKLYFHCDPTVSHYIKPLVTGWMRFSDMPISKTRLFGAGQMPRA